MITIIIDRNDDWERLRKKYSIDKDETFYMETGNTILVWFMKDGVRYAMRGSAPPFEESIRARMHDSE
ncbi:MAG: hypothetical protein R6U32_00015 [Candidatus Woesearchaeota archaeon]